MNSKKNNSKTWIIVFGNDEYKISGESNEYNIILTNLKHLFNNEKQESVPLEIIIPPPGDHRGFELYLNLLNKQDNTWFNATDFIKALTFSLAIKDYSVAKKILKHCLDGVFAQSAVNDIKEEFEIWNYLSLTPNMLSTQVEPLLLKGSVKRCINNIVAKWTSNINDINIDELLDLPGNIISKVTKNYFLTLLNIGISGTRESQIMFDKYLKVWLNQYKVSNNNIFRLLRNIKEGSSKKINTNSKNSLNPSNEIKWEIKDYTLAKSFYLKSSTYTLKYFSVVWFTYYNKNIDQLSFAFQIIKNPNYFTAKNITLCVLTNTKLMYIKTTNTIENNNLTENKTYMNLVHSLNNDKVWFYKASNFSELVRDDSEDFKYNNDNDSQLLLKITIQVSIDYSCIFSHILWNFDFYYDDDNLVFLSKSELKILINSPDLILGNSNNSNGNNNSRASNDNVVYALLTWWNKHVSPKNTEFIVGWINFSSISFNTWFDIITKYQKIISSSRQFEERIQSRFHEIMLNQYSEQSSNSEEFSRNWVNKITSWDIKHSNNHHLTTENINNTSTNSVSCLSSHYFPNVTPTNSMLVSRNHWIHRNKSKTNVVTTALQNDVISNSINWQIRKLFLTTNNTSTLNNVVNTSIHSQSKEKIYLSNIGKKSVNKDKSEGYSRKTNKSLKPEKTVAVGTTKWRHQIEKIERMIYEDKIKKRYGQWKGNIIKKK